MRRARRGARPTACTITYGIYATDARTKNYVHALVAAGYEVDVFALAHPSAPPEAEVGMRFVPSSASSIASLGHATSLTTYSFA